MYWVRYFLITLESGTKNHLNIKKLKKFTKLKNALICTAENQKHDKIQYLVWSIFRYFAENKISRSRIENSDFKLEVISN